MNFCAIAGCLLGTAAGDSIGLLYENLTPGRLKKLYGGIRGQRFFMGRGMISDDTEHAIFTALALARSGGFDVGIFSAELARQLKRWILSLPPGVGFATLRACLRLLAGYLPSKSGVFSAGNGPSMRAAILGVCLGGDAERLAAFVRASTFMTHTDEKAYNAALAVAAAARISALSADDHAGRFMEFVERQFPADGAFVEVMRNAVASASRGEATGDFVRSMGLTRGISGYSYHTVPAVIQCWLRHPRDLAGGVIEIAGCGGDTDTTAAILGAIIGAGTGREGIPEEWLDRLFIWPYSVRSIERLSLHLFSSACSKAGAPSERIGSSSVVPLEAASASRPVADGDGSFDVPVAFAALRNFICLAAILFHVIRRLLPPY